MDVYNTLMGNRKYRDAFNSVAPSATKALGQAL